MTLMRIAILSDIHDNIWKLGDVLKRVRGADALVFCGDFCAPFTLTQMAQGFNGPVHVVWGNNDGDKWLLTRNA
jgi:predicted phosphodiesterase